MSTMMTSSTTMKKTDHDQDEHKDASNRELGSIVAVPHPPQPMSSSIVVFHNDVVPQLESSTTRLPPNYVGVRTTVLQKQKPPSPPPQNNNTNLKNYNKCKKQPAVGLNNDNDNEEDARKKFDKFVIRDEDGNEIRRMTKSEKRVEKMKRLQEVQLQLQQQQQQQLQQQTQDQEHNDQQDDQQEDENVDGEGDDEEMLDTDPATTTTNTNTNSNGQGPDTQQQQQQQQQQRRVVNYHQLPVDTKKIEEELAESRLDIIGGGNDAVDDDTEDHASAGGGSVSNNSQKDDEATTTHDDITTTATPPTEATATTTTPTATSSSSSVRRRLPVVLSPPMSLQAIINSRNNSNSNSKHNEKDGLEIFSLQNKKTSSPSLSSSGTFNGTSTSGASPSSVLTSSSTFRYDHRLSQVWSDLLKTHSIDIAEKVRNQEDMRPLAYRLHPEPWQRLRIPKSTNAQKAPEEEAELSTTIDKPSMMTIPDEFSSVEHLHNIVVPTSTRRETELDINNNNNNNDRNQGQNEKQPSSSSSLSMSIPKSCEWAYMICRPASSSSTSSSLRAIRSNGTSSSSSPLSLPLSLPSSPNVPHDAMLSVIFEYIYTQTPYFASCGAKFGCDFLIYDGPRHERHAFAGLKILSSSTTLDQVSVIHDRREYTQQKEEEEEEQCTNQEATTSSSSLSPTVSLPLPTAYSLTSFVRCLNTAGKLALIATVVTSPVDNDDDKSDHENGDKNDEDYRILFVDVALEKVLDAPTHKRKQYHNKRKKNKNTNIKSGSNNNINNNDGEPPLQKRKDMSRNLEKHQN